MSSQPTEKLEPTFFSTPADFEAWLTEHHETADELFVGYYKKATGKPSMTWPESVDEALCFGWIDGIRRRIDDQAYCIRFTPRRPKSIWSAINIARVKEISTQGRMRPSGKAAYARRTEARSVVYSYEYSKDKPTEFGPELAKTLAKKPKAETFFQQQPPGYRKRAVFWVQSAKKTETQQRRMAKLIASSLKGERQF